MNVQYILLHTPTVELSFLQKEVFFFESTSCSCTDSFKGIRAHVKEWRCSQFCSFVPDDVGLNLHCSVINKPSQQGVMHLTEFIYSILAVYSNCKMFAPNHRRVKMLRGFIDTYTADSSYQVVYVRYLN